MCNPLVRFFGLALGLSILALGVMFLVSLWGKPSHEALGAACVVVAAALVTLLIGSYLGQHLLEWEVKRIQLFIFLLALAFWTVVAELVGLR